MDVANCTFRTLSDLDAVEKLPPAELIALIRQCENVCEILAGVGNPDLFGIGVSSNSFQLFHIF